MSNVYKKIVKSALLSLMMVQLSLLSFSATYYVSSLGNDSNSGLSSTLTWKTLAKVNASNFAPGDQILFKRGDTFYGTLTIKNSGVAGNPITFGAYGTGANPIITGFTTVTEWTNLGGNIWESTNAVSTLSTCIVVAVNGNNVRMGRFPNYTEVSGQNRGYLIRVTDAVNDNQIQNSSLSGINWTGADVVARKHHTAIERATITSQSGDILYFPTIADLGSKAGFFIQNDIRTLDVQNEWYYNPSTKKLSIYSTSQPTDVKVSSISNLFTWSGSYITVENITFSGSNATAIYETNNSAISNFIIQNCTISFSGDRGIHYNNINTSLVDNCTLNDITGIAIYPASSSYATLTNNYIRNVGVIMGANTTAAYSGILTSSGNNFLIQYNEIVNCGNNGINFGTTQTEIRNNFVDNCNLILADGAAITGHAYSGAGTIIDGNIAMNGYGAPEGTYDGEFGPRYSAGIYTDDNSEDCVISNNSIYGFPWNGIYLKTSDYITTSGNTCFNNKTQFQIHTLSNTTTHNIVNGNKFISMTGTQTVFNYYNVAANTFNSIISADNNYYARPINDSAPLKYTEPTNTSNHSFSDWKVFSGLDANSYKSPVSISSESDLQFEYNASKTVKTVSLSRPMIDVKGTKYATSISLQPYTSAVLMKDPNPTPVDINAPVISSFSIPSTSTTLVVSNISLNVSDNVGVTGYLLSESNSKPTLTATGWSANKPSSYTFTSYGSKSIYAWTKDAAGNISSSLRADVVVLAPVTSSIEYKSICEGTNYNGWTVTGKYERTLVSKLGGDSIVTTYLTVNPKYLISEDITINEGETYSGWAISGQYTRTLSSVAGCDSTVITNLTVATTSEKQGQIDTNTEYTQSISLKKGNNLISSYLLSGNPDVAVIMKSLCDQGALYKMQDESGNSLEYWGKYGGWINKIGDMSPTEGYNVRVKFDCTLEITGTLVSLPLDIVLKQGWNFISFPHTESTNAMTVIQSLIDQNKLVKVQDEKGNSIENLQGYGWVNNIGNFDPGKAYKVYVNEASSLTILDSYPKSGMILTQLNQPEYFKLAYEGNGLNHMNIHIVGLNESGLSVGDEIAAFDGDICVGALKLTQDQISSGLASLVSSYFTSDLDKNGFTNGDQILVYAWDKETGKKSSIQLNVINGRMSFEQNASVLLSMNYLTTDTFLFSELVNISVFPNPSRGSFAVRLNEIPNQECRIEITDLSGRMVAERQITGQTEKFDLNNQSSGMYLVKAIIGQKTIVNKLILNK